jgi:hypothetical protein
VPAAPAASCALSIGRSTRVNEYPGIFIFKREGEAEKVIKTGDSFFEPAGVTTERFDNASSTEPAELIAFYLTDSKDRALIEMLGTK